ncbi:MAG: DUF3098 domain-containing protein [Bacteroidales bacterium]|jgi:uncharacterized membrane protein|nr:DUF3098 domain-containing protein [Bacteroidales bacterium]
MAKENSINKSKVSVTQETKNEFVLGNKNYIILAIGFAVLVIGYFLLSGGKPEDPTVFNPEVYSFRRITVAPIIILIGFIIEVFGIMWKFNSNKDITTNENE